MRSPRRQVRFNFRPPASRGVFLCGHELALVGVTTRASPECQGHPAVRGGRLGAGGVGVGAAEESSPTDSTGCKIFETRALAGVDRRLGLDILPDPPVAQR